MRTKPQSDNDRIHALLLEFVDLGRRAKSIDGKPEPIARSEHDRIVKRIRAVASEVVELSEHIDRHNEYLQIFSAAAIIASAATEDPELEKNLIALSCKVSKIAPQ